MKKKHLILGAGVLCAFLILFFTGFFYQRISYRDVKEVRLYTYDHTNRGETGLTKDEAREIIRLYNRSRHGGEIDAEPCCAGYCVTINLTDGSTITVQEGVLNKVILTRSGGHQHYLINQTLIDYILELAEQYDLPSP